MRSHYCNQMNESLTGQAVQLCGWTHRYRDHGGVLFVDLRDSKGLVQLVFSPDQPELLTLAENLRSEYVIQIKGIVNLRPEGTENLDLDSGKVEIKVTELIILNSAE